MFTFDTFDLERVLERAAELVANAGKDYDQVGSTSYESYNAG